MLSLSLALITPACAGSSKLAFNLRERSEARIVVHGEHAVLTIANSGPGAIDARLAPVAGEAATLSLSVVTIEHVLPRGGVATFALRDGDEAMVRVEVKGADGVGMTCSDRSEQP